MIRGRARVPPAVQGAKRASSQRAHARNLHERLAKGNLLVRVLRRKDAPCTVPFRSEGLGHFPTSNFQPTRRSAGGENTEVGTRFLCLLRMFLSLMPLSLTTEKKLFCQTSAKEKRCNSKKIATLSKSCSVLSRTFLFALFFDFGNLLCRCGYN